MKRAFALLFPAVLTALFAACGEPALPSGYTPEFPELPAQWLEVLGRARWRLEWRNARGETERTVTDTGHAMKLVIPPEWPSPILAWPFWPGLESGLFRPAGAIYPLDAEGSRIRLSWQGGVDAAFFLALEEAAAVSGGKAVRQPRYFDWPRFRDVMAADAPARLRDDPWLTDWKNAAVKTISSSFRASYIKAAERAAVELAIPHDGPWVSCSPFRAAEHWKSGVVAELALGVETETMASPGGLLFLSKTTRLWVPGRIGSVPGPPH
jgi:hypothetical protein